MTTFIYPYSPASTSARLLAETMQIKRLKRNPRRARTFSETDYIINWGATRPLRNLDPAIVFNKPANVKLAVDKLQTYDLLKTNSIPTLDYTTDITVARNWLRNERRIVFGRNTENGNGGNGITVYDPNLTQELNLHKFYTKHWPHTYEVRIHIILPTTIHYQRKIKTFTGFNHLNIRTNPQTRIRNYNNGWRFTSNQERLREIPLEKAENACLRALAALNLNFGAFDVLIKANGDPCILECNTAPGIEGTTVTVYAEAFRNYITQSCIQ